MISTFELFICFLHALILLFQPHFCKLTMLPCLEPWATTSIMYCFRKCCCVTLHNFVMTLQEIPHKWDGTNFFVLKPLKPMKESTSLGIHNLRRQNLVLRMPTIVQHHGRPVLPWIHSLHRPVHFCGLFRSIVMMHTHDGILIINQIPQFLNVS